MRKQLHNENIWLGIIVASGFFFRLYFSSFSLSNDELSAIHRLDFDSFGEMIKYGVRPDGHPALAQVLLWLWTSLFGLSPAAVRFPFIIISSLAPLFAYLFMKNISGKAPALFLAAALAFLHFPILYGQLARPYGIGLSFVMAAAWLWSRLLFRLPPQKKNRFIITFSLALAWTLCLYTHYFAALTAFITGITGFFFTRKDNLRYYLAAAGITLVLFSPHLPITIHQISLGGVGQWLAKPSPSFLKEHILFIFNNSLIIIFLFLLTPKDFSSLKDKNANKIRIVLLLWFIVPFLAGYFYSVFVNPVLQNRVLIFSMPFLLAFLLSFNYKYSSRINKIALLIFSVILTLNLLFPENLFRKQHFGEFAAVPKIIKQQNEKYGTGKVLNIIDINHRSYLDYYCRRQNIEINYVSGKFNGKDELLILKNIIDTCSRPYIVFADLQNTSSHIAVSIIMSKYGKVLEKKAFGDKSTILLFEKTGIKHHNNMTHCREEYCYSREFPLNAAKQKIFKLDLHFLIKTKDGTGGINVVFDILDKKGNSLSWHSVPIAYLISRQGYTDVFLKKDIKLRKEYSKLKIYVWNKNKKEFWCLH